MSAHPPSPTSPSETAREALRQLARKRLPPTPENYEAMFRELAGDAPRQPPAEAPRWMPGWVPLLRDILRQLEGRHAGLTTARKRESLEHVLAAFASDEERAHARLTSLVQSWAATPAAASGSAIEVAAAAPAVAATAAAPVEWLELLAGTIEFVARSREGGEDEDAKAVVAQCRASPGGDARALATAVRRLWLRWELRAGEREEIVRGLASLLRLLSENVGELVADDTWMRGQVEAVRILLAQPVTRARLRDAERGLRAVIYKQSARKLSLDQAKQALKDMVAAFVTGLEEMSRATGQYQARIAAHRRRMEETEDIAQLPRVVEALLEDTRLLQADILRRREHVQAQRSTAAGHEARIRDLENELEVLSERIREDPLTGLLNRRGFDEAVAVEEAREARSGTPVSVAILDVDHFKRLNDAHGHATGDRALEHLAGVIRETLRPTDIVARYGGEEFVILLPETAEAEAAEILLRVQRELTRRLFLANDEHVLITFSAGVATRRRGEARDELIDRADRALYAAKHAGRNRVEKASELP